MDTINQKPNYYIFCGIDGVLWDLKSGFTIHGPYLNSIKDPVLKQESVQALNLLLKSLEKTYNTKLVITSKRRTDLSDCARYLSTYRIDYDKPIFATRFTQGLRGEKIIDYMKKENNNPEVAVSLGDKLFEMFGKHKENGDFSDYVVLEDNQGIIKKHIPANRTIKTDIRKSALTINQVVNYLMNNGLDLDEDYLSQILGAKHIEL